MASSRRSKGAVSHTLASRIFAAFADFLEKTVKDVRDHDPVGKINPDAVRDAARAFALALSRKAIGKQFLQLSRIVPDEDSFREHARALLFIDRDPEWLREAEVTIRSSSPDLFELLGKAVTQRRKRGHSSYNHLPNFALDTQVCLDWGGFLHRASLAAGCARSCALAHRPIELAAYRKALRRLGLRPPGKPRAEITLRNVTEYDQRTEPYLAVIRQAASSQ